MCSFSKIKEVEACTNGLQEVSNCVKLKAQVGPKSLFECKNIAVLFDPIFV